MTNRATDLEPRLIPFSSSAQELRWYGMAILFYRVKPVAVYFLKSHNIYLLEDNLYSAYERRTIFQWIKLNYPVIKYASRWHSEEELEQWINAQVRYFLDDSLDKSPQMCDITMFRISTQPQPLGR